MLGTGQQLVGIAADPLLPAGVSLRQVAADTDMRAIAAMESEVWGQDWGWLADDLIARIASAPDDIAVFAVHDQAIGRLVSAAWLVLYPGTEFAGLWGGSTLVAWRGRSGCRPGHPLRPAGNGWSAAAGRR